MFEPSIKNFNINFDVASERTTFYSGGQFAGRISFELTKEMKVSSVTMTLSGKANVHWSTGGGGGRKGRRRRRHHSAKLDFFQLKSVILQENRATGGTTKLQAGTHMYPFTCHIPEGYSPGGRMVLKDYALTSRKKNRTFILRRLISRGNFPSSFHGVHGQIVYSLTVGINRPWRLSKDFVTELNFVSRVETNHPELRSPLSGTNNMTLCCLWCASGPITLTASAEKKAFMPGETVRIFCDFINASSRTATPKLKLKQKQAYYTHNKATTRVISETLVSVPGQPVGPNTSDVHTEILLTIPSSAPLTISNCSILHVDYMIEVTLYVSASHDLTVLIPIILCDTPVTSN